MNCCHVYWGTMRRFGVAHGLVPWKRKSLKLLGSRARVPNRGGFVRRSSLAARLIHPWDKPMGVCTRKSATVSDWRVLR